MPNVLVNHFVPLVCAIALGGCAVGPDFHRPSVSPSVNQWQNMHNSNSIRLPVINDATLPPAWWHAFNDSVLDELENRALTFGPDIQTAALRFFQARMQRAATAAQRGVNIDFQGTVNRQRISEYGAGTRTLDAVAGASDRRKELVKILSTPYTDYQTGFDASWEPDFWGRVRRSIEAADADVSQQAALLEWAKLTLVSEVAQNYFDVRTAQAQMAIHHDNIAVLKEQIRLLQSRVRRGMNNAIELKRQHTDLALLESQLPDLQAHENAAIGRITLLLGAQPGTLNLLLAPHQNKTIRLPDLSIGLPSEVARRRPDILAAEAGLHSATAQIGIAKAALYPSVRIGASFGLDSYKPGQFSEWSSRFWSVTPRIDLPVFDHGRRVSTIKLRELQQQEAAVNYQQTVLKAWKEIDEALTRYAADQQQVAALTRRSQYAGEAYQILQSRYRHGMDNFDAVLDSQRSWLKARNDLTVAQGQLSSDFVAINKAIGNVPR